MKAIILCGTLKKEGHSNTVTLSRFFARYLERKQVECEIIRLAAYNILPGTTDPGDPDDAWPELLPRILASDIVIFATPIWWGGHASEIQKVIERLDARHDLLMKGQPSGLEGKAGGIIVSGDSDGAQHIIGNIANFFNAIGMHFPPFASLTVMMKEQAKGKDTPEEELLRIYEEKHAKTAEKMANELVTAARGTVSG